jgi:tetratricopeptide (TPR) repeat protein
VSPRSRVVAIVAAVAAVAALIAVAVAVSYAPGDRPQAEQPATPRARPGRPALALRLGARDDAEARALLQGAELLRTGRAREARRLFARYDSLEAKVGQAFAAWPVGTTARMAQLAGLYPRSALVQLHLGLALFWAREPGAAQAWREAEDVEPDTPYAIVAEALLHPEFAPELPVFVPATPFPAQLQGKPASEQLRLLRAGATRSVAWRLYYGVALQRSGRRVSARRTFDAAVRVAPDDPEPRVAAAVARFDKDRPAEAFGKLGPLTRRFPRSATVRFHLGLLLLWSGRVPQAKRQLRLATSVEPGSPLAGEAKRWLVRLRQVS